MQAWHLLLFDPSPTEWSQHPAPISVLHFANKLWVLCFAHGRVEGDLSKAVGALGAGLEQRVSSNLLGQLCDANRLQASAARQGQ